MKQKILTGLALLLIAHGVAYVIHYEFLMTWPATIAWINSLLGASWLSFIGPNDAARSFRAIGPLKILVCGSRSWFNVDIIRSSLINTAEHYGPITLIHGAANGADTIAGRIGLQLHWTVRTYPVLPEEWKKGRLGGMLRNARMLETELRGLDVCLAFELPALIPHRTGTGDMVARCRAAGVPVRAWVPQGRLFEP